MIKSPNLVSWWRMEGNSNDASGSGYNGTDTSMTYGSSYGKFGQGADFNGTTSYIELPLLMIGNNTSPRSISAWVYPTGSTSTTIYDIFHSAAYSGTDGEITLHYVGQGNGNVQFVIESNNGTTNYSATSGNYAVNNWYHVVGTIAANGVSYIYVNGVQVGSQLTTYTPFYTGAPIAYDYSRLGADNYSTVGSWFAGYLDEVLLFKKVLTQSEIQSLMMNFSPAEI